MAKKSNNKKPVLTARNADRHELYEAAVQNAEAEIDFVNRQFTRLTGRQATKLREDFCGTANAACEWVRRRRDNTAVGLDLDAEVMDWGKKRHVAGLKPDARERLTLLKRDVRTPGKEASGVDMVLAMNFSYWIFKQREELLGYFSTVCKSLVKDGMFFLDSFGGWEAQQVIADRRKCRLPGRGLAGRYTYVWDHSAFNPITSDVLCKIHFEFPDGTRMRNAFTYDWRLWTLRETRELLLEAGFGAVTVYWEGDDGTGGGNGIFTPRSRGANSEAWIAYIAAEKAPRKGTGRAGTRERAKD